MKLSNNIGNIYKTKNNILSGTNFKEVEKQAKNIFKSIKTKRTPYIRSRYFKGEKIFLNVFWRHFYDKHEKDRVRRLKYYDCALDLIKNTVHHPITRENFENKGELLHRFSGITKDGNNFTVQVKEDKRNKRKDLISIFPK